MSKYTFEFEIDKLPKMYNQLTRGGWFVRMKHTKAWHLEVHIAVSKNRPVAPLKKAKLTLTRCSSNRPDFDGLTSGFKPVIDGLIRAGVLENDDFKVIGIPDYQHERAKRGEGKIRVKIEEI